MTATRRTAHIAFTTHWDREWVQTCAQYRIRLVNLIDNLIEILHREPELRFCFDGQAIVLQDYLEVRPERRDELRSLAQAGRLVFGPWYVLADQFLQGPEATVRNLLHGFAACAEFGGPMLEGYVPDSFGSIAALPAILNGFGIRYANLGRGFAQARNRSQLLFRWTWKDGSEVLAMAAGYGNGIDLAYPDIWDDIAAAVPTEETVATALARSVREVGPGFPGENLYLSVGIDHMEMRPGMGALLRAAQARTPGVAVIISTPSEFLAAAERDCAARGIELESICAEMRGDASAPMHLQGVLSTGAPLKQANRAAELLLERVLEPLAAMTESGRGRSQRHFLAQAWKLLLACQPHDSICACSTDAVMRDVELRLTHVRETCEMLIESMLEDLTAGRAPAGGAEPAILLLNTWPRTGSVPIDTWVRIPLRLGLGEYELLDEAGAPAGRATVTAQRAQDLETHYATVADLRRLWRKEPAPRCDPNRRAQIQPDGSKVRPDDAVYSLARIGLCAEWGEALGWRVLRLRPAPSVSGSRSGLPQRHAENTRLRVDLEPGGGLTLTDKASGQVWRGLFTFEDQADAGHTYDFNPVAEDVPLRSAETAALDGSSLESDGGASLSFTLKWPIPLQLAEGGARQRAVRSEPQDTPVRGRRAAQTTLLEIRVSCTLAGESDRLDVAVDFVNTAIQHRLRVALKCDAPVPAWSGAHFSALERSWQDGTAFFTTFPFSDYLHLNGLAVMAKGLHEAELRSAGGRHELLITLCRSVDTMAGAIMGVNYDVEHAKVLTPLRFEFAVSPSPSVVATARKAASFVTPLLAWGARLPPGSAPPPPPIAAFQSTSSLLTCLKPPVNGGGLVIRCFNLGPEPDQATIVCAAEPVRATRLELSEAPSPRTPPTVRGHQVHLTLLPYEIATVALFLPPSSPS